MFELASSISDPRNASNLAGQLHYHTNTPRLKHCAHEVILETPPRQARNIIPWKKTIARKQQQFRINPVNSGCGRD
jgi:hypothetical protein